MQDRDPVLTRMRADWNARAVEDANYYVAFGGRDQDEEGFQETAGQIVRGLEWELRRLAPGPEGLRALEIGCGPGRLIRPLSKHFTEIVGVDVSDEMVRLANQRLRDVPNARATVSSGTDLSEFGDRIFDFVYSYAVFQHVPDAGVVWRYMDEAFRVLRPGGILKCHFNGLPETNSAYDTWSGARLQAGEIENFARQTGMRLLSLEGEQTQYLWASMRRENSGWAEEADRFRPSKPATVRRVTNAYSAEPAVPASGRFASLALWVEGLEQEGDLLRMRAAIADQEGKVFFVGPLERDGLRQVNVRLPEGLRTGLVDAQLFWGRSPLTHPVAVRILPAPPPIPRVIQVSDGVNLVSGLKIRSGSVKLTVEEVLEPEELSILVQGMEPSGIEYFCTDPAPPRYEVNLTLPQLPPGDSVLDVSLGKRVLGRWNLQVIRAEPQTPEH